MSTSITRDRGGMIAMVIILVLLITLPTFGSQFFVEFVMTRSLILGLAASTLIFLSAYGGMVSLAQLLMYGVAGFVIGNCVAEAGSKGLKLGLNPWVAVVAALVITTIVAFVLGALSSRTFGIYFLMLTLTYAVIGYYVFGQVANISGFGGITGLDPPALLDGPVRLYYVGVALSVLAYLGFRAIVRTPFGVAFEGVRDDPIRMSSLGFHVPLHRTLAFTLAGFVAATAGVLNVWWNGQIDPNTVSIGSTIDLLVIAVIGGIGRLEGAWLGAVVFVVCQQLPARSATRRHDRPDRGTVQHRCGTARAAHRRPLTGRTDGDHPSTSPTRDVAIATVEATDRARRDAPSTAHWRAHHDRTTCGECSVHRFHTEMRGKYRMSRQQRPRKGTRLLGAFIALSLVAAACGDDDDADSSTPANTSAVTTGDSAAPDTAAPDTAAPDTAPADTDAPTDTAAADGEGIKLGIMAECEGAFGGFNEDVQAGVALAMINEAGATTNSPTTATEGFSGATAGGQADRGGQRRMWRRHSRPGHPGDPQDRRAGRCQRRDRAVVR